MRPGLIAVATLVAVTGCTTTRQIPRPQTTEQLRALVWPKRAHIALVQQQPDGLVHLAVPPSLAPVAIPFPADDGPALPRVELSNLRGYEVKRRGRGALEGLGIGILSGFLAGAVFGTALGDDKPCPATSDVPCIEFSSGDMALLFGALGAFAGAGIGALTGTLVGHTDLYTFTATP